MSRCIPVSSARTGDSRGGKGRARCQSDACLEQKVNTLYWLGLCVQWREWQAKNTDQPTRTRVSACVNARVVVVVVVVVVIVCV